MKTINAIGLTAALFTSAAFAGTPCDGFNIVIQNQSSHELVTKSVSLDGGNLTPGMGATLNSGANLTFSINNNVSATLSGSIEVRPTAVLEFLTNQDTVQFTLENLGTVCKFTDTSTPEKNAHNVTLTSNGANEATYTIRNRQ